MIARMKRLWLETLPTNMKASTATLSLFGKGAFATVEQITNGFVLRGHLAASRRQRRCRLVL